MLIRSLAKLFSISVALRITWSNAAQTTYRTIIDDGIDGPCQQVFRNEVTKVVFVDPIYINTFVVQNTTFEVNDHLTVTVDNAPTSIDTVTYGTSSLIHPYPESV